jgi:hypothetical protein
VRLAVHLVFDLLNLSDLYPGGLAELRVRAVEPHTFHHPNNADRGLSDVIAGRLGLRLLPFPVDLFSVKIPVIAAVICNISSGGIPCLRAAVSASWIMRPMSAICRALIFGDFDIG